MSSFMSSQTAAIFGTAIATLIPASQYSGFIDRLSSLEGIGAAIGHVYPMTYFLMISRGTFSKALGFASLQTAFNPSFARVSRSDVAKRSSVEETGDLIRAC